MSKAQITKHLEKALLQNGQMDQALYERELEEMTDDLTASMVKDRENAIFAITEADGAVAMLLIEKGGKIHINEESRDRLKELWPAAYENNIRMFMPAFAEQLDRLEIPIFGFAIVE